MHVHWTPCIWSQSCHHCCHPFFLVPWPARLPLFCWPWWAWQQRPWAWRPDLWPSAAVGQLCCWKTHALGCWVLFSSNQTEIQTHYSICSTYKPHKWAPQLHFCHDLSHCIVGYPHPSFLAHCLMVATLRSRWGTQQCLNHPTPLPLEGPLVTLSFLIARGRRRGSRERGRGSERRRQVVCVIYVHFSSQWRSPMPSTNALIFIGILQSETCLKWQWLLWSVWLWLWILHSVQLTLCHAWPWADRGQQTKNTHLIMSLTPALGVQTCYALVSIHDTIIRCRYILISSLKEKCKRTLLFISL